MTESRRQDTEKTQNQAADAVSGEGGRLYVPRDGATYEEGVTIPP